MGIIWVESRVENKLVNLYHLREIAVEEITLVWSVVGYYSETHKTVLYEGTDKADAKAWIRDIKNGVGLIVTDYGLPG